jgi:hypothetical protein
MFANPCEGTATLDDLQGLTKALLNVAMVNMSPHPECKGFGNIWELNLPNGRAIGIEFSHF